MEKSGKEYLEEQLFSRLPKTFRESEASIYAKKVMGALLLCAETFSKVRETGVVVCSNETLREKSRIGKRYLLPAVDELVRYGLIERNPGKKWKADEKKQASEYLINFRALTQPLPKKELEDDDFLAKFSFLDTPRNTSIHGVGPTSTPTSSSTPTYSYSSINSSLSSSASSDSSLSSSIDSSLPSSENSMGNSKKTVNEKLLGIQSDKEFFENCCKLISEDFHGFSGKVAERFDYLNDQGEYWSIAEKYLSTQEG